MICDAFTRSSRKLREAPHELGSDEWKTPRVERTERTELSHVECTHGSHWHWTARALLKRGGFLESCKAAMAINTTAQLNPEEKEIYAWEPPQLDKTENLARFSVFCH